MCVPNLRDSDQSRQLGDTSRKVLVRKVGGVIGEDLRVQHVRHVLRESARLR